MTGGLLSCTVYNEVIIDMDCEKESRQSYVRQISQLLDIHASVLLEIKPSNVSMSNRGFNHQNASTVNFQVIYRAPIGSNVLGGLDCSK